MTLVLPALPLTTLAVLLVISRVRRHRRGAGTPDGTVTRQPTSNGRTGYHSEALPVYLIALEEARTAFTDLAAQPEKIRRNVGGLLGLAAVTVSIFGFTASRPTSVKEWIFQIGALVGLAGLALSAAYVTRPVKVTPSMRADDLVGWGDAGDDEASAVRNLALAYEDSYRKNRPQVRRMFSGQQAATVFFGLPSSCWPYECLESDLPDPQNPPPEPAPQPAETPPSAPTPPPEPTRPSPAREVEFRSDPRTPRIREVLPPPSREMPPSERK